MQYFDSHIHLTDNEYSSYLSEILFSLRSLKIRACSVTINIETTQKSLALFSKSKDVVSQFVGIHPEHVIKENFDAFVELIRSNIKDIDGIGEIGMDPSYVTGNEYNYKIQKKKFQDLLDIAEKFDKPVSIHSRKSLDDIFQILPSYKIKNKQLHWFAGNKKQLKRAMDLNLYVSFGPIVLYSSDKKVLLSNTHTDKILVETDGPVRYGNCFNYLPSSSISSLLSVIKCIGDILNLGFDEITRVLKLNSQNFLSKEI